MVKMYSDPSLILHLTTASFIRFFDASFMLDLIFDNKQKRPPISIIPILTLKMVLDYNNAIRKKKIVWFFPLKMHYI